MGCYKCKYTRALIRATMSRRGTHWAEVGRCCMQDLIIGGSQGGLTNEQSSNVVIADSGFCLAACLSCASREGATVGKVDVTSSQGAWELQGSLL